MNQRALIKAYLAKNKKKPPSGEYGYMKPGAGIGTQAGEKLRPRRRRPSGPSPADQHPNLH